jgi:hypothetical protein
MYFLTSGRYDRCKGTNTVHHTHNQEEEANAVELGVLPATAPSDAPFSAHAAPVDPASLGVAAALPQTSQVEIPHATYYVVLSEEGGKEIKE